ncbi:transglutaminase family protein [uncultured Gemmiger sp.]|uniref:transglutaminase-like domain-containing protein n=1 Tax=uncultured Gemmiger sp. TaxID=1623490 RepID=UPI0025EA0D40|nr:transglutaminase family protein [uncultured Gemmiger sp.]
MPARYAEGYYLSADASAPGTVTLTGKDTHAWAEVYFDGVGWLPLDTTPGHYFEAVALALLVAAAELWRAVRICRVEHAYRRADPMRRAGMIEHQLFALLQAEEIDSTLGYETKAVDACVAEKFEKVKPGEFARTCALLERCVYGGQAPDAREERALSSFLWKLIRSWPKHTLLQNLKRRYRRI